jgi:hypothetical protein
MANDDAPIDIYVAAYGDAVSAQQDWDGLKELAKDKVISVEALVLVSRDDEGKIHVKDNAHDAGLGAAVGAAGAFGVGGGRSGHRRQCWICGGPSAEAPDQERPRGDPPARQLWHCGGVRGALGDRCGKCPRQSGQDGTPPRARDCLTGHGAQGP